MKIDKTYRKIIGLMEVIFLLLTLLNTGKSQTSDVQNSTEHSDRITRFSFQEFM